MRGAGAARRSSVLLLESNTRGAHRVHFCKIHLARGSNTSIGDKLRLPSYLDPGEVIFLQRQLLHNCFGITSKKQSCTDFRYLARRRGGRGLRGARACRGRLLSIVRAGGAFSSRTKCLKSRFSAIDPPTNSSTYCLLLLIEIFS